MIKTFGSATLSIECWTRPESDKGEKNPFANLDPEQAHNPYANSATVPIPEELVPELITFLEDRGVFMGHVRGVLPKDPPKE